MSDNDDVSLLAAGYYLGSLTPQERDEYEAYLASSDDAAKGSEDFEATAEMLAHDVAEATPSADLKSRLLAQIAVTPQVDPARDAPAPPTAVPDPVLLSPVSTARDAHSVGSAEERAKARWFTRPGTILGAAAAAIALFVGGGALGMNLGGAGGPSIEQSADALAQISAAPDVHRSTKDLQGGGTATVVSSLEQGKSVMVFDGLKKQPDGKTYQLWYISDGVATSAGLMSGSSTNGWHVLDGTLKSDSVVGLTVEPAGGSKEPTTKPLVAITT